jgi:hypothetical protein
MATFTAEAKNSIAAQSQYKLLIGSGYFINIGSAFNLQIQPVVSGLTAEAKTAATFTSENKT